MMMMKMVRHIAPYCTLITHFMQFTDTAIIVGVVVAGVAVIAIAVVMVIIAIYFIKKSSYQRPGGVLVTSWIDSQLTDPFAKDSSMPRFSGSIL